MGFLTEFTILERAGIESGTRQAWVFGVGTSLIIFVSIIMAIRIFVRIKIIHAVGIDDSKFLVMFCQTHGPTSSFEVLMTSLVCMSAIDKENCGRYLPLLCPLLQ